MKRESGKACPSCGRAVAREALACACGARWVALQLPEPEFRVPRVGKPVAAMSAIVLTVLIEAIILVHEVYVSPFVWTEAIGSMLVYLARFFVPVILIAAYLAYRGRREAQRAPDRYGGERLARAGLAAAMLLLAVHAGVFLARIPRMIENGRIRREAATRANLYRLAWAIETYRQQYGTYPRRLIDLQEMDPNLKPAVDAWGREFVYSAISGDVAAAAPMPFQRYQLVSKGPDGILGTTDDIVLRDDLLLRGRDEGMR
ncbi:MAG: type II secretion system protein GspG [Blastocatellia bacterium]|nr:type II secretion system protein GspG [Blastocatellia bacterium]MCS7158573.1 type II secretion system protein GspG [Blastocatellia bacterium]MDW8169301.1 hypothetical protein [Acidobacteriota bacterium]MDW8257769.1 hypothetical protein [Acidobacteriota bacterium]